MWTGLIALMLAQPVDVRCTLRVSVKGTFVDGNPVSAEQAVTACKRTSGATVIVEDGAPADVWPSLRHRLEHERVKIYLRGVVDDRVCNGNPLAKGCH